MIGYVLIGLWTLVPMMPTFHIPMNLDLTRRGFREDVTNKNEQRVVYSLLYVGQNWICRLKFSSHWKYLPNFILFNMQGAVHNIYSKHVFVTTGSSLHFYNTISIWHVAGNLYSKSKGTKGFRLSLNTQFSRFSSNIDINNRESRDAKIHFIL